MFLSNAISHCEGGNIPGVAVNNTLTLAYSIPWERGWVIGPLLGSAIIPGIEEVHRRQLLPGYDIEWVWADSYCEPRRGMLNMVNMWKSVEDLDGIIGGGCSVVCQPIALLAAAWNIPVVSWGCGSASLSDKATYPTFTRPVNNLVNMGPIFQALSATLGWNRVAVLTTPQDIWKKTGESIKKSMEANGGEALFRVVQPTMRGSTVNTKSLADMKETLKGLQHQVRIFYVLIYESDLYNLLTLAVELGMANGQYVFVTSEYHKSLATRWPYNSSAERRAIEGLMGLSIAQPDGQQYQDFLKEVIKAFQHPRFANVPHLPLADCRSI